MKLNVLQIIPAAGCNSGATCPTLAKTDRDSYVLVGTVVTDPEALSALGIGPDEQAVEVPASLLEG